MTLTPTANLERRVNGVGGPAKKERLLHRGLLGGLRVLGDYAEDVVRKHGVLVDAVGAVGVLVCGKFGEALEVRRERHKEADSSQAARQDMGATHNTGTLAGHPARADAPGPRPRPRSLPTGR